MARNKWSTLTSIVSTSEFGIKMQGRRAPIAENLYFLSEKSKEGACPPLECSFDVAGEGLTSFPEDEGKFTSDQLETTRWWSSYLGRISKTIADARRGGYESLILYGIRGGPFTQFEQKYLSSPEFDAALQKELNKHYTCQGVHQFHGNAFRYELKLISYKDFCSSMDENYEITLGKHFCSRFKEYSFVAIVNAKVGVQLSVQVFEETVQQLCAEENYEAAKRVRDAKAKLPQLYVLCERMLELEYPRSGVDRNIDEIATTKETLKALKNELEMCLRPPTWRDMLGSAFSRVMGFGKAPEPDAKRRRCAGGSTADSKQDTEAPELDPKDADAWKSLGNAGGGTVAGKLYSKAGCYEQALVLDPKLAAAWCNLGAEGGGTVAGKAYTEAGCFVQALNLNPKDAVAWCNLGIVGGGTVAGKPYTEAGCYEQALKHNLKDAVAWLALGFAGGGVAGYGFYSKADCYAQALVLDPKFAAAWLALGQAGGGTVASKVYTKAGCYEQALEHNMKALQHNLNDLTCADVWLRLGNAGGGTVAGKAYTEAGCFVQALNLNPKDAVAWCNLGIVGGGTVAGTIYGGGLLRAGPGAGPEAHNCLVFLGQGRRRHRGRQALLGGGLLRAGRGPCSEGAGRLVRIGQGRRRHRGRQNLHGGRMPPEV
eukprot:TRINITY_DN9950_c0_g1_i1.p1 TRINITY_DN9950_c0_g1~~TRINITY_DN9950_c0_g1_i1.p1  ORF type:complete len:655 (+),score=89.26 TRINITY_DN9950_c0_g1_i1:103-2067(+)